MFWLLLGGNRLVIAGLVVAGTFLLTLALVRLDVIFVGDDSMIATLLASGVTSGLLALVTVALTINQLILSRVFGSPNELADRYESNLELRDSVENLAGASSSPNDPAAFVEMITEALREQVTRLAEMTANHPDEETREAFQEYADEVLSYVDRIANFGNGTNDTSDVLVALLGGDYAREVTATRRLKKEQRSTVAYSTLEQLDDILESFRAIAVTRQYLKTLVIQQELARLSRLIAYTGLAALLVTVYLTLVYRLNSSAMLPPAVLEPVASAGLAITITPLAVLIAYTLRVATIARYTVSAGPFLPPEEEFPPR